MSFYGGFSAWKRWERLYSDTSIGVDLRQVVIEGGDFNPCEDGLRSVCWKAFLLYGPLSLSSWSKKLSESRSAYESLRDHFLRFLDHPDDLQSAVDPLADDDTSPWSTLRQDESSREEILQDVLRCMQDNYFFREPTVQKSLLDILFIYSKLNPDTGYRQGMHEIIAPIFWVVMCDAVDNTPTTHPSSADDDELRFMRSVLDSNSIEHDAFSLFCAVMQTAKSFYETGDTKDSSPIVARCHKIQEDVLAAADPELAHHLQTTGILPQLYLLRWIRLLFGREFEFADVLQIWDIIFAENVSLAIIETACVTMLLQIRWLLIEADYSASLGLLLKYKQPPSNERPGDLLRHARFLHRNLSLEAGSILIQHFSGRPPKGSGMDTGPSTPSLKVRRPETPQNRRRPDQQREAPYPSISPARFLSQQKNLEALFKEFSGGVQKRTEGWNLSKALLGAVDEVKRNVNSFHTIAPMPRHPVGTLAESTTRNIDSQAETLQLTDRIYQLERRNKILAKMLESATASLRASRTDATGQKDEDNFNISIAKLQFVSVYLADADIPIPGDHDTEEIGSAEETGESDVGTTTPSVVGTIDGSADVATEQAHVRFDTPHDTTVPGTTPTKRTKGLRPSLAESSFSFMLGEGRHRSSFVSSVSDLPESRRGSESIVQPQKLWSESSDRKDKSRKKVGVDGFTMNSLQGEGG